MGSHFLKAVALAFIICAIIFQVVPSVLRGMDVSPVVIVPFIFSGVFLVVLIWVGSLLSNINDLLERRSLE